MTDMIERVARAIYAESPQVIRLDSGGLQVIPWSGADLDRCGLCRRQARAALKTEEQDRKEEYHGKSVCGRFDVVTRSTTDVTIS